MINLPRLQRQIVRTISDNSPTILTGVSVLGVVGTAYLSVRAGFEAHARLESIREQYSDHFAIGGDLTKKEMFKLTWKCYIPVVTVGALTITSMVLSNRISNKRVAAMATAYSLANAAFKDQLNLSETFKKKIAETYGDDVVEKVENEAAAEVAKTQDDSKQIMIIGDGEVTIHDSMTGRYFKSDIESIREAVNDINQSIFTSMYASLNDFFVELGLPRTGYGDEVGWNIDHKLEVSFGPKLAPNGKPCVEIIYSTQPIRDYHKVF